MIYDSSDNMEDPDSIKKILKGEHPLSKYFALAKFLVYDDTDNVKGRFCITSYEGDKTAYFGFFECVNEAEAAKFLFDSAYAYCSENGFEKIQGPVDASYSTARMHIAAKTVLRRSRVLSTHPSG